MKALVTGSAAGLGRALVARLASMKCDVVALDHDAEGLAALAHSVGRLVPMAVDLADSDELARRMGEIAAAGPFDLVVLNAGISATGRFEAIPADTHRKVIEVNVVAPMLMASGLAARGAFAPGATLIFVSSLSHRTGYPGAASYAASKDCVAVYARSVAKPFAALGIHVMIVFPGPIRTDHAKRHAPAGARAGKRMTPEELAGRILVAAKQRKNVLYPGWKTRLTATAGSVAPRWMTAAMRRLIFDKLDDAVW